jgi:hypothetical protein
MHLINAGNMKTNKKIASLYASSDKKPCICHLTPVFSTNPIYRESKQLPIHLTIYPPLFANTKEKLHIEKLTAAIQFRTRTLQNVKCHGFVYKIPQLIPVLSPVNPVDTLLPHFSEIHFHTYYNLCQYHSSCVFPSSFPTKIPHGYLSLTTCVTLPTIPLSFGK